MENRCTESLIEYNKWVGEEGRGAEGKIVLHRKREEWILKKNSQSRGQN